MLFFIVILTLFLSIYLFFKLCFNKSFPVKLIYLEIIFNCFIKFFQGYIGLPSFLNYISDLILIMILLNFCLIKKKKSCSFVIPNKLFCILIIYLMVIIFSYIVNIYNPLLFLWGIRNNMRFIVFSIMCVFFLKKEDIENILKILIYFFVLNVIVITYEYFFANLTFRTGDIISGLYSVKYTQGGNGELNWLLCIVSSYCLIKYLNNEFKLKKLIIIFLMAFYMAALSELKIFFIEIIFIVLISIVLCRKSFKIIFIFIFGIMLLNLGVNILYKAFPKFDNYFSFDSIHENIFSDDSYNNKNGVSRLGASKYVWDNYLVSVPNKIFGIGFGNADYSGIDLLTSDFYKKNSSSSYQWFLCSFVLVETGILGFLTYMFIIFSFLIENLKLKIKRINNTYVIFSIIICLLSFIMFFYNQSLKFETAGYMVYLFLSIPFILKKSDKSIESAGV